MLFALKRAIKNCYLISCFLWFGSILYTVHDGPPAKKCQVMVGACQGKELVVERREVLATDRTL